MVIKTGFWPLYFLFTESEILDGYPAGQWKHGGICENDNKKKVSAYHVWKKNNRNENMGIDQLKSFDIQEHNWWLGKLIQWIIVLL